MSSTTSQSIDLTTGTIDYVDTGGSGPTIVLLHGLLMDSTLWDGSIATLSAKGFRCVAPTLPLGAHRTAMGQHADLSLPGVAELVAELLDRLELVDVTLVGNDTGGALVQLVMCHHPARVGRVVLASCEAFDNIPPGLTGKTLALASKLSPWWFRLVMQQMRFRLLRRLPLAFGQLTRRGDAVTAGWVLANLRRPDISRDAVRCLRALMGDRELLTRTAELLPNFDRPALIVWAAEDKVMPSEHGRRLAELLPKGQLVEVVDSDTLVPLDQPDLFAETVGRFVVASVSG